MSQLIKSDSIPVLTDNFSQPLLEGVKSVIEESTNPLDLEYLKEWLLHPEVWRYPMVSFDTFIDSDLYLGQGEFVYPEIRKIAKGILEGEYPEAVIMAGIGSGKTTSAELIEAYLTHKLLCMQDPYRQFKLAKDKPIAMINMGVNATQALKVAFEGVKSFISKSPWFQYFNPKILAGEILFKKENILLISGNSKSTTPLGYNVYFAVLDEAAFYIDNENKQVAEEIYTALQRRIVSRFGYEGLSMIISSPLYEGDFVTKKIDEAKKQFSKQVFSRELPTWKGRPIEKADLKNKFYFNNRTGKVLDSLPDSTVKEDVSWVKEDFDSDKIIWEIPGEYKKSFLQDPDRAKRDLAGVPSGSIQAFMPMSEYIENIFTDEENPLVRGKYEGLEKPLRTSYYIHLDLALNRQGQGDHAGLAMARFDGWDVDEETNEKFKKVKVVLAEQISAGATGEIRFEDVRSKIYSLKKMGFNIAEITMDQFQSTDTQQILKGKGFRSDTLSVDRTIDPYNTLKELIYTGRVKCHKMPVLQKELMQLEITKSSKVDHPPRGSKDVADAVCGAVFNVIEKTPKSALGFAVGDFGHAFIPGQQPMSQAEREAKAKKDKEDRYRKLDQMARDGFFN